MPHRLWQGAGLYTCVQALLFLPGDGLRAHLFLVNFIQTLFRIHSVGFKLHVQTPAYLLPVLSQAIQYAEKTSRVKQQGKGGQTGTLQALVVVPNKDLAVEVVKVAQGLLAPEAQATVQLCIEWPSSRQVTLRMLDHDSRACCTCTQIHSHSTPVIHMHSE